MSRFHTRSSERSPTRQFVLRHVALPRSYRKSLWEGKVALARLDLYSCGHGLGLPLAVPQPRPFLPRCRGAADRLAGARGLKPCSADTGAYCTARNDLPEDVLHELVRDTGKQVEEESPPDWLWLERKVRVVDGSTVTMADTPENQAVYPQLKAQAPGCGFPIARILVIFSLSVGTVLEAAIGKYKGKQTGENSMLRELYSSLAEGDVVLADRYFSGWCDLALLRQRGIDVVIRKHQLRPTDFRTGKRLGKDDHLVSWVRPQRPRWMTADQYATLPEVLTLREIRIRVADKGLRTKSLVVVTTLLNAEKYTARRLLRCTNVVGRQSFTCAVSRWFSNGPFALQDTGSGSKEFYTHLVGYNLIRGVMAVAAGQSGQSPWKSASRARCKRSASFFPCSWQR